MKIKVSKVEKLGIILSVIGLVLIFQPFENSLFTYGFYVLSLGAVIFSLSGYLPIRTERGETTIKDLVKWVIIIAVVLLFVVVVSIELVPYIIVR